MNYELLERNAGAVVSAAYRSTLHPEYPYHNLDHTKRVVERVKELALFYQLDPMNVSALLIAAWFHDTGQLTGNMQEHEARSVGIATSFLRDHKVDDEFIFNVKDLIMVTRRDAVPHTIPEKIMCDADTWHFGTALFRETEFLVKKEMEIRNNTIFQGWHKKSLQLLQTHVYFTEYCQLALNPGKKENIEWLKAQIISANN